MSVNTQAVPNVIQGVSQQAAQQRRDSQCEAQFDCINSPVDGALARPPIEFLKRILGASWTGAYFYEIIRGVDEHYLAVIHLGHLKVYDLADGAECAVTLTAPETYLGIPAGGISRDYFAHQTVNDYTFIGNKSKVIAMASSTKPLRPKEALVFFRAGGYSMTFQLSLIFGGQVFTWKYTTPDNSTVTNGPYIFTNQLAATFYRALTGNSAPTVVYGDADTGQGVGAVSTGDTDNSRFTTVGGATGAGFHVEINGNVLRVWRTDGLDFEIDSADGQGDTYLKVFKDSAQAFSDLPTKAFPGFVLRVAGTSKTSEDDYYVQFVNNSAAGGYWEETLAPGAKTGLDATTMPHVLVNTGYRTFEWRAALWGGRVAGDEESAKEPSFVGTRLQDLLYKSSRLGIMTEGTCVWSKTRNAYVFFPDTTQTVLATAPIDIDVAASDYIPLLRKAVSIDEGLFLWSQRQQLRVSSGQDPFRQDTVDVLPSTAFEFAERCTPFKASRSLFFVTELGGFVSVINLPFSNGKPQDDATVTAHVPSYIAAGAHKLAGSPTLQCLFLLSDGAPNHVYLYNYLRDGETIIQSAWNTWRIPCQSVLWASIYRATLYLALQRADGVVLTTVNLQSRVRDPGGLYQTRLDLRIDEADCTIAYDSETNRSTVTLPLALTGPEVSGLRVVLRADGGGYTRGRVYPIVSASGSTVVVTGDLRARQFYIGLLITAERTESHFHLRSSAGPAPVDELTVKGFKVSLSATGYTRLEVTYPDGVTFGEEYSGRGLLTHTGVTGTPLLSDGQLFIGADGPNTETSVRLVNDSFLPSQWGTAAWEYEAVLRAPVPRSAANGQ